MSFGSDAIIAQLKEDGGPITRERYILFCYLGTPPDELSAEEEAEIPDYQWDADEESLTDFDPDEPRDEKGKWTIGGALDKLLHLRGGGLKKEPPPSEPPPGWHDGLKLYHGTSMRAANDILAHGIIAHQGEGGDAWAVKNGLSRFMGTMVSDPHRQMSVFMTSDPDFAKTFAKYAAELGKSQPVLFEVDIPSDQAKNLKQDEYAEPGHAYRYEGTISPSWIHLVPFPPKHGIATAFKGMDAEAPRKVYMVIFADGEEDPPVTS